MTDFVRPRIFSDHGSRCQLEKLNKTVLVQSVFVPTFAVSAFLFLLFPSVNSRSCCTIAHHHQHTSSSFLAACVCVAFDSFCSGCCNNLLLVVVSTFSALFIIIIGNGSGRSGTISSEAPQAPRAEFFFPFLWLATAHSSIITVSTFQLQHLCVFLCFPLSLFFFSLPTSVI